ncbi:MAG: hypothetical protein JJV97_01750 [SAR324 cluster bacterium]|nr:hypothetical protein [SAR324 cluster bacterium]
MKILLISILVLIFNMTMKMGTINILADERAQKQIASLRKLVLDNNISLNLLMEEMREVTNQEDIKERIENVDRQFNEGIERRLLLVETELRKIVDKLESMETEKLKTESAFRENPKNTLPEKMRRESNNKIFPSEQPYLKSFDADNKGLSEINLFQFAQNAKYIGKYKKARGYLEKYRQEYPAGNFYDSTILLSGLSAAVMKDYDACVVLLTDFITTKGSKEDKYSAQWKLAECYHKSGDELAQQKLLRDISNNQSHPRRKGALAKLLENQQN